MAKDSLPVSPLAPKTMPVLPPIAGVKIGIGQAGIKYKDRNDLMVMTFDKGTAVAGVFTKSLTRASPVDWSELVVARTKGRARALIVNSGNANAFTGKAGVETVKQTIAGVAETFGILAKEVMVSSTGVIGQTLDASKITKILPNVKKQMSGDLWRDAAAAIMTTDTFPKLCTRQAKIGERAVTINGIAKGSGMIAPDMATMLGYICTDAAIPPAILQQLLKQTNEISFNAITVDGDTSTNDNIIVAATGAAGNKLPESLTDPLLRDFRRVFADVMLDLAHQVVMDGEGAQKFITVHVTGAKNKKDAKTVAMAIANSPLIKTAIAGGDANWGRVVMAVGKSGAYAERDKLKVSIGGTLIATNGMAVQGYDEKPVAAHINGRDIVIDVDLGLGRGHFTAWTCDLTHGYISINADYRS
ncbi:MAG TPA: bifunctional glutamate N-acetyltransferase/amino-acid acetyltransferase ArgJ [Alphaproteobacteria bacterium]|nr:bifunctional ornithine acetyltransferase/N-acetylglutamate synthase [Rhodospirillaceae bacterium]HRJ11976.1 bifunctional glutamate N-acetyltransferase/amino-acid acetyltransferase ArgJ [Alphaproteobacteria bacterium]